MKCTAIEESISRFGVNVEVEEFADERREVELSKMMEKLKSAKAQSVSALTEFRREVRPWIHNCPHIHIHLLKKQK